jgi:peptide/nickel transport system substrate-binding protein
MPHTNNLRIIPSRLLCVLCGEVFLSGCSHPTKFDPANLTFLIEANPVNLDPRFAADGQSQRLDGLIFSSLLAREAQMNLHGDLAESWSTPDPLTYVFHLKPNVKFHDGRPLTSADVEFTFEFILDPANKSPKRGGFRQIAKIDAPDPQTFIFHLNAPYASFLWNLIPSDAGIVPANTSTDFSRHPIGSGPFKFVSQSQDDYVQLARNSDYFAAPPTIESIRFRIVPDAVVRALELRKGSADLEMSSLSPDLIPVLVKRPSLALTERPGTNLQYPGINLEDPLLARKEVRQALAYATDREALVEFLLHRQARVAAGILPPKSLGVRVERNAISRRTGARGNTSRLRRLSARRKRHPFPSHTKNIHRGASAVDRRSTAGAMAQSRHRPGTPPARICYAALRFSARELSAHVAALGRRQQRS